MRGLDGKTAIVAGGSTLVGQSVAETLVGYGCSVVIADVNVPDGEAATKKLGSKARFVRCDLTSDADIAALVKAAVEATGRLDYLVNVACTYLGLLRISLTYDAPTGTGKTTARTDTYHGRFVKLEHFHNWRR